MSQQDAVEDTPRTPFVSCPLRRSRVGAFRLVDPRPTTFGVSGSFSAVQTRTRSRRDLRRRLFRPRRAGPCYSAHAPAVPPVPAPRLSGTPSLPAQPVVPTASQQQSSTLPASRDRPTVFESTPSHRPHLHAFVRD